MRCIYCGQTESRVVDSRQSEDGTSIRRRRECETCGRRFTTYERIELVPMMVIKKDDTREPYDRTKIEHGIIQSCHKRPVSAQQISAIVDEIETSLFNREEREIPTSVIGEMVMEHLKDLDAVAYVRFASVYREFKDVSTFMAELAKILEHSEKA